MAGGGETGNPDVDRAVEQIRDRLEAGEESAALELLQRAVKRHGELPQLLALRSRLATALLDRDADQRQAEDPFGTVPSLSSVMVARPAPTEDSAGVDEITLAGLSPSARNAAADADSPPTRPMRQREPAWSPTPPPRRHRRSGRSGPSTGRPKLRPALTLLVIVVLLVGVGYWLGGRGQRLFQGAAPAHEEPVPPTAVAMAPGVVVLDALPWAEIVDLVDLDAPPGEPPVFDGPRVTPRLLELPPGSYRLELRYPPSGDTRWLDLEVASGERSEYRVVFREIDGEAYLAAMGW